MHRLCQLYKVLLTNESFLFDFALGNVFLLGKMCLKKLEYRIVRRKFLIRLKRINLLSLNDNGVQASWFAVEQGGVLFEQHDPVRTCLQRESCNASWSVVI